MSEYERMDQNLGGAADDYGTAGADVSGTAGTYGAGGDETGGSTSGGDLDDRGAGRTPEEIERDIEATRERMSRNIDQIGEKMSPRHIANQAQDAAVEAAQNAGRGFIGLLRENPIPAAAVGASMAWLFASARNTSQSSRPRRYGNGFASEGGYRRRAGDYAAGGISQGESYGSGYSSSYGAYGAGYAEDYSTRGPEQGTLDRAKEKVSAGASDVAEKAGELKERAADTVHGLTDRAGDVAGRVQDRTGELTSEAKYRVRDLANRTQETLRRQTHENPLMVAAGAAVLGLALGSLLPVTRKENEMIGPVRDQLVDRAQETAERVKEASVEGAKQVADTLKTEVQSHTPEMKQLATDIGDQVKEQAKDAASQVKDEASSATASPTTGKRGKGNSSTR